MAGLLLLSATVVTYLCALGMQHGHPKLYLAFALTFTLGMLGFFKYAGLFLTSGLLLPAGISFYTFQCLSYVLDVYHGRFPPERRFLTYALFVAFFPQLVAGPIERPGDLIPQLDEVRTWSRSCLRRGLPLLLTGFFRKVVIADTLARFVDPVFAAPDPSGPAVLLGAVLFGIQIYCDFAGYTDIARGSAALLGIRLSENFHQPFRADSVRDFWRRWHISLGHWFRDYVYIPLGGNRKHRAVNLLTVFLLSGIWHGAGWHFALWGLLHGFLQIAEAALEKRVRPLPRPLRVACTFSSVTLAWIFFRAPSVSAALLMLSRLPVGWGRLPVAPADLILVILLVLCLHLMENRLSSDRPLFSLQTSRDTLILLLSLLLLGLAALSALRTGSTNAFIYFQF